DERQRRNELVLVVERACVDQERAIAPIVAQRRGDLTPLIGRKVPGVAYSLGRTVEPSHTGIPTVGDLEPRKGVEPLELLRPVGEADTAGRLLGATLQDEVCGGAHLAIGKNGRRTTLHDLHAFDGVIEPERRAVLEENECRHAIERRAVHLYCKEGSVAGTRETGDFDVRARLSAGRFRPDSRG